MRYLNFVYYDDAHSFLLENESDELANLIVQFKKLNKYELVADLIVSEVKCAKYCDKLEDWIKELEDEYFPYMDDDTKGEYEIFIKIKEMIEQ